MELVLKSGIYGTFSLINPSETTPQSQLLQNDNPVNADFFFSSLLSASL